MARELLAVISSTIDSGLAESKSVLLTSGEFVEAAVEFAVAVCRESVDDWKRLDDRLFSISLFSMSAHEQALDKFAILAFLSDEEGQEFSELGFFANLALVDGV